MSPAVRTAFIAHLRVMFPGMLGLLSACGSDGSEALPTQQAVVVAAVEVQHREVSEDRSWAGALAPLRVHPVVAPAHGYLAELAVSDGATVSAGTLLLRVEGIDQVARLAVVADREARLRTELERWQELARAGAAGPGEVVTAELRHSEALEALAALEATRDGYAVRSGVEGRVVGLRSSPGMLVSPGQPLLSVEETASYGVRLRVPASEGRWFDDVEALRVVARGGESLEVARVIRAADGQPGILLVDIIPRFDQAPGPEAVVVRYTARMSAMVLPWTAVATDGDRSWVAVATPEVGEGGETRHRVVRRDVRLGSPRGGGIEVLGGLEEGDVVVRFEPRSHPEGRLVDPRTQGPGEAAGSAREARP